MATIELDDQGGVDPSAASLAERIFGEALAEAQGHVSVRIAMAISAAERAGYQRGLRDAGAHTGDLADALRNLLNATIEADKQVTDARASLARVEQIDADAKRGTSVYVPGEDDALSDIAKWLGKHGGKRVRVADEHDADDNDRRDAMSEIDASTSDACGALTTVRQLAETLLSRLPKHG